MSLRFAAEVLLVAFAGLAHAQFVPEAHRALGYQSVAEALEALKTKPGVQINVTKPDGWIIANEGRDVVWSFAPPNHYAHPAVVRRELVVQPDGEVTVETRALCQAPKEPCDRLIGEFQALNEAMREGVRQQLRRKR